MATPGRYNEWVLTDDAGIIDGTNTDDLPDLSFGEDYNCPT